MTKSKKKIDAVALIKSKLQSAFPAADVEAYRYNMASIRVRIVDERFAGLDRIGREALVDPILDTLDEDVQADITMLLLLTPREHAKPATLLQLEFEKPSASRL